MRRRRLAVAVGVCGIVTGVLIWVGTLRAEPPSSVWGAPLTPTAGLKCLDFGFNVFRDGPSGAAQSDLLAASVDGRYAKVLVLQLPSTFRELLGQFSDSFAAHDEYLGTYSATGDTRDIDGKTWRKFARPEK